MGGAFAAGLAAAGLLAVAAPAGATVTATTTASTVFSAMATSGFSGLPGFAAIPPNAIANVPTAFPVGTSTSVLPPFPFTSPYAVLSTGDVRVSDQPGASTSSDDGANPPAGHGDSAYDTTIMQVLRIPIPAGSNCLSFDFRFLSAEYPGRLTSQYNDAFIAELTPESSAATLWTTSGPSILKLGNDFALGSDGRPITIKSPGVASMSPAEAAGTPYGGATAPLRAQVPVVGGGPDQALFLSIFDHGDRAGDSVVFIDNLTLGTATCTRGVVSLGPAVAITAPTISATVDTPTPTLTGTADANADPTVTVRIYNGAIPSGAPVQTLAAPRSGTTWSVRANALAPGQYTAQATQASNGIDGVSAPATFTVAPPPQSVPSQQPPVGDKDHDGIPDDVDTSDGSQPPIPGKTFDARVVSGQVFVKYPRGTGPRAVKPLKGFVPLKGAVNLPMGSQLDTRAGRVAVTSAHDTGAVKTQTADFYDGIFAVKQATPKTKPKKPAVLITDLVLKGEPPRSECAPLKGAAAVAATTKKKRGAKSVLGKLWGNGKGRFRTNGKYSSATVRGTIWLTQDRCDGTLTTVKRGVVSVRDFKRHKTVSVKAGHSYLARAQRAAGKVARRK